MSERNIHSRTATPRKQFPAKMKRINNDDDNNNRHHRTVCKEQNETREGTNILSSATRGPPTDPDENASGVSTALLGHLQMSHYRFSWCSYLEPFFLLPYARADNMRKNERKPGMILQFFLLWLFDGTHCIVIDACDVNRNLYRTESF